LYLGFVIDIVVVIVTTAAAATANSTVDEDSSSLAPQLNFLLEGQGNIKHNASFSCVQ
jgi:hypothetical protein